MNGWRKGLDIDGTTPKSTCGWEKALGHQCKSFGAVEILNSSMVGHEGPDRAQGSLLDLHTESVPDRLNLRSGATQRDNYCIA